MNDILARIIGSSIARATTLRARIVSLVVRLLCYVWGISLEQGCLFFGIPVLRRVPGSSIKIGQACCFRSDRASNLIGVNHPCIVATHSPNAVINIGDHCGFSGTTIGAICNIDIGRNVICGANTVITDFDWHSMASDGARHLSKLEGKPVVIEDNAWLGLNCIVLKGVHIGRNSVIGANSVVTRSIPANTVAAGNPCRPIRSFEDNMRKTADTRIISV